MINELAWWDKYLEGGASTGTVVAPALPESRFP